MADKDMTFCTIFMNDSEIQRFILKVDPPWKMVGLAGDIWGNKMKLRDLWEVWEVHQFRLSNMTTKIVFVPQFTYQTSKNLFDPTVKYCTIGPYLQSRWVAFSFQERYTMPEKVSHLKLPLETSLDVQQKHNYGIRHYCFIESWYASKRWQIRQGHFVWP